ncbi:sensor domain-containing protein [Thiosocius teredinicola]|uniref:sensor domain-containing protein n=1 Tax=Thiosocius teredinicola TaxID=1973002 RepID=UPI000990A854
MNPPLNLDNTKSNTRPMPRLPEYTAQQSIENSRALEKRVRMMAVLGILITTFVVGGIATTLLYRSLASTLETQLHSAIELQASALDAELARMSNITSQITSRTRIRQELERYTQGEIKLSALVDFSVPKLADAMHSNHDVVGITRLSPSGEVLLEVGTAIDRGLWPSQYMSGDLRLGIPQDGLLVVSSPIRNRSMQIAGFDLVMFKDDRLRAVIREFFTRFEHAGQIQVASLVEGRVRRFYDADNAFGTLPDEVLKAEILEEINLGIGEGLHYLPSAAVNGGEFASVHRRIGGTPWVMLYFADPHEFFTAARLQAGTAALAVLLLAGIGIYVTNRIIHPLVQKISIETHKLQRTLARNEQLLDAVKVNEAKLQAVIDNAPAVIYIKDRDGKYILVNSSYERLVDLPREQIIGKFDHDLFPDDIAATTRAGDLEVLATGRSLSIDEKAPHADGMHDYLSTKFPLLDAKGNVDGICGISTDITDRKRAERRLALTQTTVDRANVGVYWADASGRLLYANDNAIEKLGVQRREIDSMHLTDVTPSFEREDWHTHWEITKHRGSMHYETEFHRKNGEPYPVEVYANYLAFADHEYYIALVHDISRRRESESQLRQSATVFDCTAEAIVITDTNGVVRDVNAAFTEIVGYEREEVIGQKPNMWKSDFHDQSFYADMWNSIIETGEWRGEIINRHKDGSVAPALSAISTVTDENDNPVGYVAIYTDISQIKESQQQLAHLAHHDALTNLPNRILFNERLQHCLDRAERRGGRVAVIFVDLDNFKHVNDSLGHSYGDKLLIEVADILKSALRHDDTVARIGGDEFTILLEEVETKEKVVSVIEKIIEAFDREFALGASTIRVTPSLGVSISPDDGRDADTLMRNADAAMYRAKSLGRNNYQFYTQELTKIAFERMHLDSALRKAIPQGEFNLLYQPQIDLADGSIVGMEVLVRWHNPELGLVPPDQFIPIAEDNGLILPLGEWILEVACRQAYEWLQAGLLKGTMAVNISGVQVRRGDLATVVRRVLANTGLPAEKLELEVTESFIMGESQQAIDILSELRDLGLTLAVDDFGTGYSSLSYLKSLPIHALKIDKSFIRDIPEDGNNMAITRAVIALAKSLNLELVGEGVETDSQRRFLLSEGCQIGQGFLFQKPLTAFEMERLLRDENEVARVAH